MKPGPNAHDAQNVRYTCSFCMILTDRFKTESHGDPVIGRLDVRRQFPPQRLVVEIGMQVGQDRPLRLQPLDPGQRLGQTLKWLGCGV